jgi:hypothetical protein
VSPRPALDRWRYGVSLNGDDDRVGILGLGGDEFGRRNRRRHRMPPRRMRLAVRQAPRSWSSAREHGPDIRGNRVAHRPVPSVSYLALTASRPELKTAGNGSERIGTRRSKPAVRTALCLVEKRVRFPAAPQRRAALSGPFSMDDWSHTRPSTSIHGSVSPTNLV